MDWIMDIPTEVIIGFWIGIGSIISAIVALMVAIFNGAKSIVDALAERQKHDLEADAKREAMINNWAEKWEDDKDRLTQKVESLQEQIRQAEVSQAEERGKVTILQETIKSDRDSWKKDRQELIEKIDSLEKRIAELEKEISSKDELLKRKDELIAQLIKERDEALNQLEDYNTKIIELTIDLNESREKLDDCEQEKEQTKNKITELKQPEQLDDKEDKDIA